MGFLLKLYALTNRDLLEQCISERYAHGAFLLRADLEKRAEIERYIRETRFLQVDEADRLSTKNRRYRMYMFPLPAAGINAVMKVSWDNPAYPRWRRLGIRLTEFFRDRGEAAFFGALLLHREGIPTLKPIACWTYQPTFGFRESYFLYERLDTAGSLRDLRTEDPVSEQRAAVMDQVARLLGRLHGLRLWHRDLAPGNFLVASPGHQSLAIEGEDGGSIYLIDTDSVSKRRFRIPFFTRLREIGALRRLNLDPTEVEHFMRLYLGGTYKKSWLTVYRLCSSRFYRPWRPMVRALKRSGYW